MVAEEKNKLKEDNDFVKQTIRELSREKEINSEKLSKAEKDVDVAVAATTALAKTLASIEKQKEDADVEKSSSLVESLKMDVLQKEMENDRLLAKLKETNKLLQESRETISQLNSSSNRHSHGVDADDNHRRKCEVSERSERDIVMKRRQTILGERATVNDCANSPHFVLR